MKTRMTLKAIREHWHYSWWKYALLIALAIFSWNITYTITAYRPPAEKKVDVFVCGYGEQAALQAYLDQIRASEMDDMEQMDAVFLPIDETYTPMQLMTYMAAGEGDVYVLPREYFQNYAADDSFVHLEDSPEVMAAAEAAGISLTRGWRNSREEGRHLYGIPLAELPGMANYVYDTGDSFLCIIVNNGNDENSLKFLSMLVRDTAIDIATPTDLPAAQ